MNEETGGHDMTRILIIDDNPAIHRDFDKILGASVEPAAELASVESLLFGDPPAVERERTRYALEFASQGQEGVERAKSAAAAGRPFAIAFIDMRMPPGWDGLETIERLWAVDPDVQVVICSAHSDYDWSDVVARLGQTDRLLVLKKPFEPIEVLQCASALRANGNTSALCWCRSRRWKTWWPRAPRSWKRRTASCAISRRMMR